MLNLWNNLCNFDCLKDLIRINSKFKNIYDVLRQKLDGNSLRVWL